jgi:bifunctional UDP-N-acetylglucosamine pyrophosphorylase/glucosamine-1-phosphate N-acetyltransferase/UDP-N-acetylglucosamine pyrophosphorylase
MGRQAIVLAAGKGTRMESELPKVLFPVCGKPMIRWVLECLARAGIDQIAMVVGYRADLIRQELAECEGIEFVEQTQQLGTGHAVMVCRDWISRRDGQVLVVAGDSPLLQADSVNALFQYADENATVCLLGTLEKENPLGLGRIVRDAAGEFRGIVEDKDASDEQRKIKEVNMSTYLFDCRRLESALDQLTNDNQQEEYYLTDCPGILRNEGRGNEGQGNEGQGNEGQGDEGQGDEGQANGGKANGGKAVAAVPVLKPCESLSINTIDELAMVEDEMRRLGYG